MAQVLGVTNAFWVAGFIIARLQGVITWPLWLTMTVALVPFVILCLLCWWAMMYDAYHSTHNE